MKRIYGEEEGRGREREQGRGLAAWLLGYRVDFM